MEFVWGILTCSSVCLGAGLSFICAAEGCLMKAIFIYAASQDAKYCLNVVVNSVVMEKSHFTFAGATCGRLCCVDPLLKLSLLFLTQITNCGLSSGCARTVTNGYLTVIYDNNLDLLVCAHVCSSTLSWK